MFKSFALSVSVVVVLIIAAVAAAAEENPSLTRRGNVEKRIEQALAKPVDCDFHDMPLIEVVDAIRADHEIEIGLDRLAIDELGVAVDEPITFQIKQVTLRSALRLMLRDLELTLAVRDEMLLVTTVDEAENMLTTRVYPVRDLVVPEPWQGKATDQDEQEKAHFKALVDLAVSTVHCASWDEFGGPGTVHAMRPTELVVLQTQAVHDEVAGLLAALRKVPVLSEQDSETVLRPVRVGVHDKTEERIEKVLDSPTDLEFHDAPLSAVVEIIAEDRDINVRLDRRALDDLGIASDEPISIDRRGITIRSALRSILRDLELTYLIKDEVLMVTTVDEADNELSTVVYPVGHIVDRQYADDGETLDFDYRNLIKVLQSTLDPETWDIAGGPGSIVEFEQRGVLVISQTREVHRQISNLFDDIRAARKATGYESTAEKPDSAEIVLRTYWYHVRALGARNVIVPHVKSILDVDRKAGQYTAFFSDRIVVRERRAIQAELRRLLIDELKVCSDEPPKPMGVSAGGEFGGGGSGGGGGVFSPIQTDR